MSFTDLTHCFCSLTTVGCSWQRHRISFLEWVTVFPTFYLILESPDVVYSFICLPHTSAWIHSIVPRCIKTTAGTTRLTDKRLDLWMMKKMNPTQQSWSPIRHQSLRAELVSATYFVHRRGYHDTKYYKTSCSCTKTNIFVEILHLNNNWYRVKTADCMWRRTWLRALTVHVACRGLEHNRHVGKFFTMAELWHEKGITEENNEYSTRSA